MSYVLASPEFVAAAAGGGASGMDGWLCGSGGNAGLSLTGAPVFQPNTGLGGAGGDAGLFGDGGDGGAGRFGQPGGTGGAGGIILGQDGTPGPA